MNGEVTLYANEIERLLDRLCRSIEGLDETQLNWRPPAPETNSVFVIATHLLGNMEAWVLGIVAGQPIVRDRPAEFASLGPTAAPIIARARELGDSFASAMNSLPSGRLDEVQTPPEALWGAGAPAPRSGREALMHTIEHAAMHLGQIDITLDLIRADS
ncbi:MAG: DinB family protein [Dehalococcoidia bacterium]